MEIAEVISHRGTCKRAQVGCVITQENRIVSTGYNGPIGEGLGCKCDVSKTCDIAVHAEANAIAFAAREGISLKGSIMYCMTEPCINCAMLIIQSGIVEVHYENLYRNQDGSILLMQNGVKDIWTKKGIDNA